MRPLVYCLLLALVELTPAMAAATRAEPETAGVLEPTPSQGHALRGLPLPEKRAFPITHLGVGVRLDAGSPLYEKKSVYAFTDLGFMRNVSPHVALGGTLYAGGDDYRLRIGPKARFRYWMSREVSIDIAPGILVWGNDDWNGEARFPGLVGEASLSLEDNILITAQMESVDIKDAYGAKDHDTSVYLGGKLGGVPGLVGLSAGLIALFAMHEALKGL